MSDDWGDLEGLPEAKRTVPIWLWGCGGGCLLFVIVLVAVTAWGVRLGQRGLDPEVQWARLAEALPHDETSEAWDAEWSLVFGLELGFMDFECWFFDHDDEGDAARSSEQFEMGAVLVRVPRDSNVNLEPDPFEHPEDAEAVSIEVQGRTLEGFEGNDEGDSPWSQFGESRGDRMLVLELSEPTDEMRMMLVLLGEDDESPGADLARSFLAPFHIGPDRPR